jgi:hypothetical protein
MQACQSLVFGTWHNDSLETAARVCAAVSPIALGSPTFGLPMSGFSVAVGFSAGKNALTQRPTVSGIAMAIPSIHCREDFQV